MNRPVFFFLVAIFVLGFLVRLYRFDNPVADWHAFRQSDTNAVSERYVREGINFLYPKYYDISNVQSGFDNTEGYRFVEFPIYNVLQATLYNLFGILSLAQWGRLLTIFASLFGVLFVYLLTKKYAGELSGFLAATFYLFIPYSIFYSRVILPDPSMTASILAGIYFFDKWITKKNSKFSIFKYELFFGIFFTALAFLLKPFALFFTLPIVYLAWKEFGLTFIKKWQLWIFGLIALVPLIIWRLWISQFPEGIPVSDWLFNGNNIRFRPAFFRWIFFERITKLIFGYTGIIFLVLGVARIFKEKNSLFFLSFALSSLIYLVVIATGNVQHDYYQILIIPTIAIFAGLGTTWLYNFISKRANKLIAGIICVVIIIPSFYFSWLQVRDYFNINDRGMVAAGEKADEILPQDAIVIAAYDGSTTLLNLVARPGWPVFQVSIEELIDKGATHLVIANPTENDLNGFGTSYEHLASSKDYLILELQ